MNTPKEIKELQKKLFGNIAPVFSKVSGNILSTIPGTNTSAVSTAPWKTYLIGALVVFIAILIIMFLVHVLVTPVFPYTIFSGESSIVSSKEQQPFSKKTYWMTVPESIRDTDTIVGTISYNYAFTLDIGINPLTNQTFQGIPVLFYHGPETNINTQGTTIIQALPSYNVAIAMSSSIKNDLIISILNSNGEMENILLQNVPVGKGFRLGVVITDRFAEVYIGGRLAKTRTFAATPKPITGRFIPVDERTVGIAQVRNLQLFTAPVGAYTMKKVANDPPVSQFEFKEVNICSA